MIYYINEYKPWHYLICEIVQETYHNVNLNLIPKDDRESERFLEIADNISRQINNNDLNVCIDDYIAIDNIGYKYISGDSFLDPDAEAADLNLPRADLYILREFTENIRDDYLYMDFDEFDFIAAKPVVLNSVFEVITRRIEKMEKNDLKELLDEIRTEFRSGGYPKQLMKTLEFLFNIPAVNDEKYNAEHIEVMKLYHEIANSIKFT